MNDGKHTESTDGNLPCNVTLQSNVATYDRADTERIEPKLPASINATIFARNGHLHVFEECIFKEMGTLRPSTEPSNVR